MFFVEILSSLAGHILLYYSLFSDTIYQTDDIQKNSEKVYFWTNDTQLLSYLFAGETILFVGIQHNTLNIKLIMNTLKYILVCYAKLTQIIFVFPLYHYFYITSYFTQLQSKILFWCYLTDLTKSAVKDDNYKSYNVGICLCKSKYSLKDWILLFYQ